MSHCSSNLVLIIISRVKKRGEKVSGAQCVSSFCYPAAIAAAGLSRASAAAAAVAVSVVAGCVVALVPVDGVF